MIDSCKIQCWLKVNAEIFFLPKGKESYMYGNIYLLEVGMETYICQIIPEQKERISLKQCVKRWIVFPTDSKIYMYIQKEILPPAAW